jgi:hypothetical protein
MTAATAYVPTNDTTKTAVANLLLDGPGEWINGDSFYEVGGTAATRRIRQLRAEGWAIRHRRNPDAPLHFQYKLSRVPNKGIRSQYRTAVSA